MADIEKEKKEAPGKVLDRLREILHKFTDIDPESPDLKVILKHRFLIQSAPDIHHKLLKQVCGASQSLGNYSWLRHFITAEDTRKKKKVEAPTMAVIYALKQPEEKNAQMDPSIKEWACYCCRKAATSIGIALSCLRHSWLHV